jgi:hypothetical protein
MTQNRRDVLKAGASLATAVGLAGLTGGATASADTQIPTYANYIPADETIGAVSPIAAFAGDTSAVIDYSNSEDPPSDCMQSNAALGAVEGSLAWFVASSLGVGEPVLRPGLSGEDPDPEEVPTVTRRHEANDDWRWLVDTVGERDVSIAVYRDELLTEEEAQEDSSDNTNTDFTMLDGTNGYAFAATAENNTFPSAVTGVVYPDAGSVDLAALESELGTEVADRSVE